jgi:SAM-dependent methyltransferase
VACDHWVSSVKAEKSEIETAEYESKNDAENAIDHLDSSRLASSKIIFDVLGEGEGRRLLDIGCAAGGFLRSANEHGFDAYGIEPNKRMAVPGIKRGLKIRTGFFPEVLSGAEKFEVITFNDVFEHIENIHGLLDHCHDALSENGFLSISLPSSKGFLFRLAKIFGKLHIYSAWDRLWQIMFYTPHLHYFSPDSLVSCVERHGFSKAQGPIPLPALKMAGLWRRLAVNKQAGLLTNIFLYIAIVLFVPIYTLMPKDSFFIVFKKAG